MTTLVGLFILPLKELLEHPKGVARPDITDGVATLVGWSVLGVGWSWFALIVWDGSVRLQSMA